MTVDKHGLSVPAPRPKTPVFAPDMVELARELQALRAQSSANKKREDEIRAQLLEIFEGEDVADAAVDEEGRPVAHVERGPREGVDKVRLEAMFPSVYEEVKVETESATLKIDLTDDPLVEVEEILATPPPSKVSS